MQPSTKRHLPVLKAPDAGEESPQSPLLWAAYCCVITLALWVPTAIVSLALATKLSQRWLSASDSVRLTPGNPALVTITATLVLCSFLFACGVGGFVLGRFCQRSRAAHAMVSSSCTVLVILFFAALGNALHPAALAGAVAAVLAMVGSVGALVGYRRGHRHWQT